MKNFTCVFLVGNKKDKYLPKIREREYSAYKNVFSKYKDIENSDSAWAGTESYHPGMFCLVCQSFVFKDEAVPNGHGNLSLIEKKNCSANCQKQYENLSYEEQQSLKSNQIKSNQIKSNQIKSNTVENDSGKTNYLPWILGGVGLVSLIGIVVYFLTRKENK